MYLSLSHNTTERKLAFWRGVCRGTVSLLTLDIPHASQWACSSSSQLPQHHTALSSNIYYVCKCAQVWAHRICSCICSCAFLLTSPRTTRNLTQFLGISSPTSPPVSSMFLSEYTPFVFSSTYLTTLQQILSTLPWPISLSRGSEQGLHSAEWSWGASKALQGHCPRLGCLYTESEVQSSHCA